MMKLSIYNIKYLKKNFIKKIKHNDSFEEKYVLQINAMVVIT